MVRVIFIFLIVGVTGAYAAGVRVHPTAIPAYFQDSSEKTYVDIRFPSGTQMTAELAEENENKVVLNIDGGLITFDKNEISSLKVITEDEIVAGTYEGLNVTPKKEPLITFDKKDGLFNFKLSTEHVRMDQKKLAQLKEQQRLKDYYDRSDKKHAETLGKWKKQQDKLQRHESNQAKLGYDV